MNQEARVVAALSPFCFLPLVLVSLAMPVRGSDANEITGTSILQEDFKQPKLGRLPEGWSGSASIGVGRDGDISWLRTTAAGWQRAWSSIPSIAGDFQLECQFILPSGSVMRLAVEGEGTRDMVVGLDRFHNTVSLTGAEWRRFPPAKDKVSRMVLQREGRVFSLTVDGTELVRHRLDKTERFARLAIDLNDTATQVHELVVRTAETSDTPRPTMASADTTFSTDFVQAPHGDLPKGWTGPTALGVKDGNLGWLRSSKTGMFAAKSGMPKLAGDFQLDSHLYLPSGSTMSLNLHTGDGKPLTVVLDQFHNRASMPDADAVSLPLSQVIRHLAFRRVGTVYTLAIDGQELVVHRLEDAAAFEGVELAVNDTSTLIYDVSIRQLDRVSEKK